MSLIQIHEKLSRWSDRTFLLLLGLVYVAIYGCSLSWGWLGFDDTYILKSNPNLGHGLSSFWWGLTSVVDHRYTPGLWTLANGLELGGLKGFHLGSLLLTWGVVQSLFRYLRETGVPSLKAFWCVAIFTASPLRWETSAWSVGFIYAFLGLVVVQAARARLANRPTAMLGWGLIGLLTYPQIAGIFALWGFVDRARWQGRAALALVIAATVLQVCFRAGSDLSRIHANPILPLIVLPHYLLVQFLPLTTVPIVPAKPYGLLLVGVVLGGLTAIHRPKEFVVLVALIAPTILASITEPFWWAARYALLPSLWFAWFLSRERWGRLGRVLLPMAAIFLGAFSTRHVGFRSIYDAIDRAHAEALVLYDAATVEKDFIRIRSFLRKPP